MNFQQTLHRAFITFCIVFTCSTLASTIVFAIAGIPEVHIFFMTELLLLSILTSSVVFVFYSKKELSERQIIVRYGLAYVLALTAVVALAYIWEWLSWTEWSFFVNVIILTVIVALVYAVAVAADYYYLKKVASDVVFKLEERNK